MIVVDTAVWIRKFHGFETNATRLLARIDPLDILIGDIVLLEVLQGARSEKIARMLETTLRKFDVAQMLNADLASAAAINYRRLRTIGITVRRTPDLIIATFCIERGHRLLHEDRDFVNFEQHLNLQVIH